MIADLRRARPRPGFTLIETVTVIGGIAVALGLCATLLHALMRLDRAGRAHLAETAAIGRLAEQFRRDVRDAAKAEPKSSRLELAMPDDRAVTYEARDGAIARVEKRRDEVVRRESYRVRRGAPRFETEKEDGGDGVRVALVLANGPDDPSPVRALRIEATLGKDRLMAGPGGSAR